MADLFGAPNGFSQGLRDSAFIAEEPLQLARLGQEVQQGDLKTQTMRLDLESRKKMMQAMSSLGSNPQAIKSPADLSDALGGMWLQAGDPDKAMSAFSSATLMRDHQANMVAAQARSRESNVKADSEIVQYEVGQLQGVSSQAELDALTQRIEAQYGKPPPWKGQPYSPELKDKIANTLLTSAQRQKLALDKEKLGWQQQYQGNLLALRKAQLRLSQDRESRLSRSAIAKEGKVSEPTQQQVNQASSIIRLAHPSFLTAPEDMQDNLSAKVAEKARELMAANKGLRFTEAAQQALADPTIRGDLKAISDVKFSGDIWNKISGATPPENEKASPMQGATSVNPLPYSTDPTSYQEGQWYFDAKGEPAKFMTGPYGLGLYNEGALGGMQ